MDAPNKAEMISKHGRAPTLLLVGSAIVFLFFLFAQVLISDLYQYPVVGALFEFLSIPMLLLLVVIPILCIIQLTKPNRTARWYAAASLAFIAAAVFLLMLPSK
jgi:hypothetical protein